MVHHLPSTEQEEMMLLVPHKVFPPVGLHLLQSRLVVLLFARYFIHSSGKQGIELCGRAKAAF
jgi:hypothetical protein